MDVEEKVVTHDEDTGTTRVVRQHSEMATTADIAESRADKKNQIVWYIIGLIEVILALRIIFRLLGAHSTGFTQFIYSVSDPFVAPFRGIFAAPQVDAAYFDTAALVAMVILLLLGWAISALIDVINRPAPPTRTV